MRHANFRFSNNSIAHMPCLLTVGVNIYIIMASPSSAGTSMGNISTHTLIEKDSDAKLSSVVHICDTDNTYRIKVYVSAKSNVTVNLVPLRTTLEHIESFTNN